MRVEIYSYRYHTNTQNRVSYRLKKPDVTKKEGNLLIVSQVIFDEFSTRQKHN